MKFLQKISKLIVDQTSIFVIAIAVIAYFVPSLFTWVKGNTQTIIIGLIMLTMGISLTTKDFEILAKRPLDILIGCLAQYTVMPFLAYLITKALHLPTAISVGLILVGCCPGGVSSNIMSFLCKGDVAFSVGMTAVSTLLAPILTPALMLLLAGQSVEMNAIGMFISIVEVTIVPIAVGFLLNKFLGNNKRFVQLKSVTPGLSVIGLALIVGGVIAVAGDKFFSAGLLIFAAICIHNILGYSLGYVIGKLFGMSEAKKRTISIEVGMQNAGLATNLASAHFAAYPMAAVSSAVACVWHSISGTLLAQLYILIDKRRASLALKTDKIPLESAVAE
ncbi:MAG: sodium transporter [Treponema sp. CETP13]|nr:MAG: sodium transporter [Treponema sp. CETP13]